MLRVRLLLAALIIFPLLGLLAADFYLSGNAPGIWLVPLGLVVSVMAAAEFLELLQGGGRGPLAWTVYVGVAFVFLAAFAPLAWNLAGVPYPPDCPVGKLGWPLFALAGALGLVLLGEMLRFREPGTAVVNLSLALFSISYVGVLMAFLVQLRFLHDNAWGMSAFVSLIFVAKFSDTGAYMVGKSIGRWKMAPRLSPGKTVEGAIGGIATGALAALVYFQGIVPWIVGGDTSTQWWRCLIYGALLALIGILGDLSESLVKRDMGKELRSWLPGLGGILDLLDSVLAAAPAAYACWVVGLVGP